MSGNAGKNLAFENSLYVGAVVRKAHIQIQRLFLAAIEEYGTVRILRPFECILHIMLSFSGILPYVYEGPRGNMNWAQKKRAPEDWLVLWDSRFGYGEIQMGYGASASSRITKARP